MNVSVPCAARRAANRKPALNAAARHSASRLLEPLEPRWLNAAGPTLGDGHDYVFLAANQDDPVETIEPQAVPAQVSASSSTAFQWLDGTTTAKMTTSSPSVGRAFVDGYGFWARDKNQNVITYAHPDEQATRSMARYAATLSNTYVIDIEDRPVDVRTATPAQVSQSIAMFKRIIGWIRSEEPQMKIAMYDIMSLGDLYDSRSMQLFQSRALSDPWYANSLPEAATKFAAWQAANEYLRPLADAVDFIAPSLYTRTTDISGEWTPFAEELMDDARRYGKPVMPLVWGVYHPCVGGALADQPIDMTTWQGQLDLIRSHADGMIAWSADDYSATATPWAQRFIADAEQEAAQSVSAQPPMAASYPIFGETNATDENDIDAGSLLALAA